MRKNAKRLEPGDVFFHPPCSRDEMEAIWLAVRNRCAPDQRLLALSLHSGIVVDIGSGDVRVFDNVEFLEMPSPSILRPSSMDPGSICMTSDAILVKGARGCYYSFDGIYFGELSNRRYQMIDLHVGMHGHPSKSISSFELFR